MCPPLPPHRLPSEHPSLIKWSAPAFVKIRLASLGLSLGYQAVQSFTVCVSSQMRVALYQQGGRSLAGLEANLSCGGLQHKVGCGVAGALGWAACAARMRQAAGACLSRMRAHPWVAANPGGGAQADLITAPTSKNLKTVGLNSTRGALVDVSFAAGSMSIDDAKNALVYGPGVTPLNILHGGVQPPREMQPLYAALNSGAAARRCGSLSCLTWARALLWPPRWHLPS